MSQIGNSIQKKIATCNLISGFNLNRAQRKSDSDKNCSGPLKSKLRLNILCKSHLHAITLSQNGNITHNQVATCNLSKFNLNRVQRKSDSLQNWKNCAALAQVLREFRLEELMIQELKLGFSRAALAFECTHFFAPLDQMRDNNHPRQTTFVR